MRGKAEVKSRSLPLLYTLCISLLWGCTSRAPGEPNAATLHEQAILVLREGNDREHLEKALELTTLAVEKDPNYPYALNTRAQVLLELGRHEESIADLERLVAIKDFPERRMFLCLVKDVAPGHDEDANACYHSVAATYKEIEGELAYRNINYLFALKMANAQMFQIEADRFIAEIDEDSEKWDPYDFKRDLLETDRDELLEHFVGTPGN
ncbi:MAG: tetratricopeptide repeat protein [Aquisalimonadaceae bacterium]